MKTKPLVGSSLTIHRPIICPSQEAISEAAKVLGDQQTAVYQQLFANGLTEPGGRGQFRVERFVNYGHTTTVVHVIPNNPEHHCYKFGVYRAKEVMPKVRRIVAAIKKNKKKVHALACCPLAKMTGCVCVASFSCIIHGNQCHGSHD